LDILSLLKIKFIIKKNFYSEKFDFCLSVQSYKQILTYTYSIGELYSQSPSTRGHQALAVTKHSLSPSTRSHQALAVMVAPTGLVRQGPPRWTVTEDIHYKDIYDPLENEDHIGSRLVYEAGRFHDGTPVTYMRHVPYEGYGRESAEKKSYMKSINRDHPLWGEETPSPERTVLVAVGGARSPEGKGVCFNDVSKVRLNIGGGDTGEELIDLADRQNRISWNFAKMLEAFVEGCTISERKAFFKKGGVGWKWAKDRHMMERFGGMFAWISEMKVGSPGKKIAISDIAVKNYPDKYYRQVEELFLVEKNRKSELNPLASEFVPAKDKPEKPAGQPSRIRPVVKEPLGNHGATMLAWSIKQENDKKIDELDRKLQELIELQGTVVCAERVE